MTFAPFRALAVGSTWSTGAIIGVSVLAIGSAVYLTPGSESVGAVPEQTKTVIHQVWPTPQSATSGTPGLKPSQPSPVKSTVVDLVRLPSETSAPGSSTDKLPHCWDFAWQQDAQAAYEANLSDPGGLDGQAGPNNGDGLACNQLPVDVTRAASSPIGAIPATVTTAPSKADILGVSSTYYGVASDAIPGDAAALDDLDAKVGKAPSLVEFFDTWDHPYAQDGPKIEQSWARGALPVLTWMPEAQGGTGADQSAYTLDHIIAGDQDAYLYQWAAQVVQAGLPLAIRFAHEMNGSWYPWSAGLAQIMSNGSMLALNNTPAKFIKVWQHVWNIFQDVGANNYVIWAWTPVTTLCTNHGSGSGSCGVAYTTYAEDYPGDSYVDWIGLSTYASGAASKFTFAGTFQASFKTLAAVSNKPVYIAETGAAQRVTTPGTTKGTFASAVDQTALKVQWTTQALQGFLVQGSRSSSSDYLNPGQRVIGFVLFDNYVPNVHSISQHSGANTVIQLSETDWRLDSSPEALAAFKAGVADSRYLAGLMPAVLPTTFPDPNLVRWPVVPPVTTAASGSTSGTPSGARSTSSPSSSPPSASASASGSPSGSASGSAKPATTPTRSSTKPAAPTTSTRPSGSATS